jgi:hypothetical protein
MPEFIAQELRDDDDGYVVVTIYRERRAALDALRSGKPREEAAESEPEKPATTSQ